MSAPQYEKLLAEMPAGLDRAMLHLMDFHVGKERVIGRSDLIADLKLIGFPVQERQARQCIHDLRRRGFLICSTPGESGGYYLAANAKEFYDFCNRELHPKAIDMLETEMAMRLSAKAQFGEGVQESLI